MSSDNDLAVKQLNDFSVFLSYKMTWLMRQALLLPYKYDRVCLFCGNQCLAEGSKIFDPVTGESKEIQTITGSFHVEAWDGEKVVVAKANEPFSKGMDDIYKVSLRDGSSFLAAPGHIVLTPSGWLRVSELRPGYALCRPQSNSEFSQSVYTSNEVHSTGTERGCQGHHLECRCSCGGPLHQAEDISPTCLPSPNETEEHTLPWLRTGAPGTTHRRTPFLSKDLLPNRGAQVHFSDLCAETVSRASCRGSRHTSRSLQASCLSPCGSSQGLPRGVVFPQSANLWGGDRSSHPYSLALSTPSSFALVSTIVKVGEGVKWDFEVPGLHNYIHNGVIHHNSGKSCYMAYSNVLKFLGSHPCPRKNVLFFECKNGHEFTRPAPWPGFHHFNVRPGDCFWTKNQNVMPKKIAFPKDMMCPECGEPIYIHKRGTTTFRMASENLPEDKEGSGAESAEIRNRTYPELKKWLPPFLLKRDITARTKAIIITNPNKGEVFGLGDKAVAYDGPDIVVEFVSYSQDVQSGAGSQRLAVSCDEEPGEAFWEEQLPRLIAENGEMQIFLTPAQKVTWTFSELFEQAAIYIRTPAICDFYKTQGEDTKTDQVQKTKEPTTIAVLQAATDDNPTLDMEAIKSKLTYDDPDTEATRRYGIFRQASGRIFKMYDSRIHEIDENEYFPHGIPQFWTHGRGIDIHPHVNWACGAASMSPTNEMFIWTEAWMSPDKFTTLDIMDEFSSRCMDHRFKINLLDPEARTIQKDTITLLDDINRISLELKKSGNGTGGYWTPWDTKGLVGRNEIKMRLQNSRLVGRPFNNLVTRDGSTKRLPTLWLFSTCKNAVEHMKKWSWDVWADSRNSTLKDAKDNPQQKYSHFNMVWEALLKNPYFKAGKTNAPVERHEGRQYYKSVGSDKR